MESLSSSLSSGLSSSIGTGAARALAAAVEAVADDVRALALQADGASAAGWRSTSAEAFRQRLGEEVAALRVAATRLDEAARMVRQHAAQVDGVLATMGSALGKASGLATGLVSGVVSGLASGLPL